MVSPFLYLACGGEMNRYRTIEAYEARHGRHAVLTKLSSLPHRQSEYKSAKLYALTEGWLDEGYLHSLEIQQQFELLDKSRHARKLQKIHEKEVRRAQDVASSYELAACRHEQAGHLLADGPRPGTEVMRLEDRRGMQQLEYHGVDHLDDHSTYLIQSDHLEPPHQYGLDTQRHITNHVHVHHHVHNSHHEHIHLRGYNGGGHPGAERYHGGGGQGVR